MATSRNSGGLSLFPSESSYQRKPSLRKKRSRSPIPPSDPSAEHTKNPSGKRDMHTTVIQVRSESPSGLYQYPAVPKRTSTPVALAPLPSPRIREPLSPHVGGPLQNSAYNSRPVSGLYDMASPVGNIQPPPRGTSPSPTDTDPSSHLAHSSPATSHSATPPMVFTQPPKPPTVPFSAHQAQQRAARSIPRNDQAHTQPPSPPPTGPAPVPITSIFPPYDPNVSLMDQHYAPAYNPLASATSPTSTADDPTSPLSALSSSPPQSLPLHALSRPAYSPEIARACSPPLLGGFVSHDRKNEPGAQGDNATLTTGDKDKDKPKLSPKREKADPFAASAAEDPRTGPQFPPPPTKEVKTGWREQRERRQKEERARQQQEKEWQRERQREKEQRRERSREQKGVQREQQKETGKLAKRNPSQEASRTRGLGEKDTSAPSSGTTAAEAARANRWDDEKRAATVGEDEGGFARFLRAIKRLFGIDTTKRKSRAMARGPNSSGWL